MPGTSGYPKQILTDAKNFHVRLLCCICQLILRIPVQSVCGHRFCQECVQDLLNKGSATGNPPRCPTCDDTCEDGLLTKEQICPDFHARRELRAIPVKCCNENCPWQGEFQKYIDHESECEFEMVKCLKAGCGKPLRRAELAYHLEKDCPMRRVRCRHCGEETVFRNMKKHHSECRKLQVSCNNCGKKIARDLLQQHKDQETGDCPKRAQICSYAKFGCNFQISGSGIADHLQKELVYHTQLIISCFDNLLHTWEARLTTQEIILTTKPETTEAAATSDPKAPSFNFSVEQIDYLVNLLKQWFITKQEAPKNDKVSNKINVNEKIIFLESKVREGEEELNKMKTLYAVLDKRNETFQEVVAVLNNQLEVVVEKTNALERENRHLHDIIEQQEKQIHAHDQMLTVKNVALAEQELRIQTLEATSHNGILVWKITDFARRRREAVSGKTTSFYSQPFYTSYHGYKMRARIYLNGDGMGKGTHLSLFFVVMKGRYDNILRWPFHQKVTFMMVDQGNREHVVDSFRPDPTSSSFKYPTHEMNIASGCPMFLKLDLLDSSNHQYIKDDCIFVKVIVDVSDLERM